VLTQFVVARTESLRDLVSTILETNLTIQGNRQNAIMEKGHQLGGHHRGADRGTRLLRHERSLPGFGQHSGVITSTVLLVVLSGSLYILFKRFDWL
jgi:magnesium transporter